MWPAVGRASFFNPNNELRVTSLRVTSYELRVTSFRVTSYEFTSYEFTSYELRVYGLRVTSLRVYELRVTGFEFTGYELRVTSYTVPVWCFQNSAYTKFRMFFYYKFNTVYGIGLNSTESCGILYYGSDEWRVTSYECQSTVQVARYKFASYEVRVTKGGQTAILDRWSAGPLPSRLLKC